MARVLLIVLHVNEAGAVVESLRIKRSYGNGARDGLRDLRILRRESWVCEHMQE